MNNTVVITGASSGIGRACALHLDGRGWRVFAGVRRQADAASLQEAASERLVPLFLDVTDEAAIAAAREQVENAVGAAGLHGLVNNAGIPYGGPVEFLDLGGVRRQLEVNLIGVIGVTQAFLPLLRPAGGRIVNIGSGSGLVAYPFTGSYAASKFGLEAINDALRVELRPWDIKVTMVVPGDVDTDIWSKTLAVIDETDAALSPAARALYGPALALRDHFQPHGYPPRRVAIVVERALTARRPRARYLVGWDIRTASLLRYFPVRLRDWIITQFLPVYGRGVE